MEQVFIIEVFSHPSRLTFYLYR